MTSKYIIKQLTINGLSGRYLSPSRRAGKNIFLIVGDYKSSIEGLRPIVDLLSKRADVYGFDLPGIGGMESFYRVSRTPTLDNYADYLQSVIKLKFRGKRIVLVGVGSGFAVVTMYLQKTKTSNANIKSVINFGGISHHFDAPTAKFEVLATGIVAKLASFVVFRFPLEFISKIFNTKNLPTTVYLKSQLFKLDLCNRQIDKSLTAYRPKDNKVDEKLWAEHLRIAYKNVRIYGPLSK